jgi:hypothetical protein
MSPRAVTSVTISDSNSNSKGGGVVGTKVVGGRELHGKDVGTGVVAIVTSHRIC